MRVRIKDFDDLGNGLSKIDNKVIFIKRGLKDEILEIEIKKEKKNYLEADIKDIIKASSNRINPVCKFYNQCGGCNFLHTNYQTEKEFKENKGLKFLGKIDNFFKTLEFNYRDKVTLHVKNGEIGYYEEKSNNLVKIDYCYLLEDKINEILKIFLDNFDSNFNGDIIIRENYKEEILVSIDGKYKYINKIKNEELIDNLVYNDQVIKGNNYFFEQILDYKFRVSYKSFFQVNRLGLERIFNILKNYLENKNINRALDLYSGTSVLGILISKYVKSVVSVEINKLATIDALENIKINNISNLEVINGKVEDYIDTFKDIDLVIVDPARRGLDRKTIDYLKQIRANYLIYIACSMDSLKRDLVFLKEIYNVDKIELVDMFPRTNNVECVSVLHRKNLEK